MRCFNKEHKNEIEKLLESVTWKDRQIERLENREKGADLAYHTAKLRYQLAESSLRIWRFLTFFLFIYSVAMTLIYLGVFK